jgi:hypothetical protein
MRMTTIHAQAERKRQDRSVCRAEKAALPGQNAAGSRLDPPDFGRLRDDRHRSGRKTLAQRAKSGDLEVKRQATWGMSA